MANVMFKRGVHSALPTGSNIQDGVFYLTTDTNRLYVGKMEGATPTLVELNQSITTIATEAGLPSGEKAKLGQYYYVTEKNALAYYNGTSWVQINGDTTLVSTTGGASGAAITDGHQITTTVTDTASNTSKATFAVIGDDAVSVTGSGTTIQVSAHDTKYNISAAESTVTINEQDRVAASVVLGSDVEGEEDSFINIYGGDDAVTVEKTEHGISITAKQTDMYNTGVSETFDTNGKHTTSVTDGNSTKTSTGVTPTVKYGNGKTAVFKQEFEADGKTPKGKPTAELDVYDKAQVDSLISMADAMHYMGTVIASEVSTKLDITKAQNGDTYKAAENLTVAGQTVKIGDLIIAKGTEGTTGKLDTTAVWEVIPSGDSQVVSVLANADTNKFTIQDNAVGNSGNLGSITFVDGGENIKVTSTVASGNKDLTTTIAHDVAGVAKTTFTGSNDTQQASKSQATFTAITKLSYDENGHIVSADDATFTVVDTHNNLDSVTITTTGGGDTIGTAVTATTKVTMSDGSKSAALTIDSDSLLLKQNNGTVSIDMTWGSF